MVSFLSPRLWYDLRHIFTIWALSIYLLKVRYECIVALRALYMRSVKLYFCSCQSYILFHAIDTKRGYTLIINRQPVAI